MTDLQNRIDTTLEEEKTVTITLEQDVQAIHPENLQNIFEIIYFCFGDGALQAGRNNYLFKPGDVCLIGPDFPFDINFESKRVAAKPRFMFYRLRFRVTTPWEDFIALTENTWMHFLLQQASHGLFITGDHYNEIEKVFRQLHSKANAIASVHFLRCLREIFELQKRNGKVTNMMYLPD